MWLLFNNVDFVVFLLFVIFVLFDIELKLIEILNNYVIVWNVINW